MSWSIVLIFTVDRKCLNLTHSFTRSGWTIRSGLTKLYSIVWCKAFRYLEPFRRDSRVW